MQVKDHVELVKSKVEAYLVSLQEAKKHLDRVDIDRGTYYSNTFLEAMQNPKTILKGIFDDI